MISYQANQNSGLCLSVKIKISKQMLCLYANNKIVKSYPVSTSKYGVGNIAGSNKTPLGLHQIVSKIGRNAALGTIFKRRRNTGKIAKSYRGSADLITTRILRLAGLEKGINKGKGIDIRSIGASISMALRKKI